MGMQEMRKSSRLSFRMLVRTYAVVMQRLDALGSATHPDRRDRRARLGSQGISEDGMTRTSMAGASGRFDLDKMERKSVGFEQLSDIFGYFVVVIERPPSKPATAFRLGVVAHHMAGGAPARFKDYISTPKQNDYRSIHTP